jgi:hypothetical protein
VHWEEEQLTYGACPDPPSGSAQLAAGNCVQLCPHAPQLLLSIRVSTHVVPHGVCPAAHAQLPLLHVAPTGHWWPQLPQLNVSVCKSTHAPLHRPLAHELPLLLPDPLPLELPLLLPLASLGPELDPLLLPELLLLELLKLASLGVDPELEPLLLLDLPPSPETALPDPLLELEVTEPLPLLLPLLLVLPLLLPLLLELPPVPPSRLTQKLLRQERPKLQVLLGKHGPPSSPIAGPPPLPLLQAATTTPRAMITSNCLCLVFMASPNRTRLKPVNASYLPGSKKADAKSHQNVQTPKLSAEPQIQLPMRHPLQPLLQKQSESRWHPPLEPEEFPLPGQVEGWPNSHGPSTHTCGSLGPATEPWWQVPLLNHPQALNVPLPGSRHDAQVVLLAQGSGGGGLLQRPPAHSVSTQEE